MFEYVLILKGTNKDLSKFEFENLWQIYFNENIILKQLENTYYYFTSKFDLEKKINWTFRLTFTNEIYKIILKTESLETLKLDVDSINFCKFKNKTFKTKVKKLNFNDNSFKFDEYLKIIWNKFKKPIVNLNNPELELLFYHNNKINNLKKKLIFAYKIFENKKEYLKRMPKLRPIKKPYTLKSDMARASINYLNIKEGIILDPFIGIGGILLEAYDMNFEIIGNDINYNDLKNSIINFDYYFPNNNMENMNFVCGDAQTQFLKNNSIDGIVTDIPYGKSSRLLGNELYENFLKSAKKYLKKNKRIVVIYANFTDFKNLALKYFDEIIEIEEYINKSMTRYILVLENNKK